MQVSVLNNQLNQNYCKFKKRKKERKKSKKGNQCAGVKSSKCEKMAIL